MQPMLSLANNYSPLEKINGLLPSPSRAQMLENVTSSYHIIRYILGYVTHEDIMVGLKG